MASEFSGGETRRRAEELTKLIGANHHSIFIDHIIAGITSEFQRMNVHSHDGKSITDKQDILKQLKFDFSTKKLDIKGSPSEYIALQNIQARSRMTMAYMLAQLLPYVMTKLSEEGKWPGSLLVLGS